MKFDAGFRVTQGDRLRGRVLTHVHLRQEAEFTGQDQVHPQESFIGMMVRCPYLLPILLQVQPANSMPRRADWRPWVSIDLRQLRQVLVQFATGITVIATRAGDGDLVGLTVNSFGALSLAPPLITWALRLNSSNLPVFQATERFVVNVLAEAQVEVSRRFASGGGNRFDGISFALGQSGLPLPSWKKWLRAFRTVPANACRAWGISAIWSHPLHSTPQCLIF